MWFALAAVIVIVIAAVVVTASFLPRKRPRPRTKATTPGKIAGKFPPPYRVL